MLAAAAIYALDHHRERLNDDHANAKMLAEALAACQKAEVDPKRIETNIVYFDVPSDAAEIAASLEGAGLRCLDAGPRTIRLVTSLAVDRSDIDRACSILKQILDS